MAVDSWPDLTLYCLAKAVGGGLVETGPVFQPRLHISQVSDRKMDAICDKSNKKRIVPIGFARPDQILEVSYILCILFWLIMHSFDSVNWFPK